MNGNGSLGYERFESPEDLKTKVDRVGRRANAKNGLAPRCVRILEIGS